MPRATDPQAGQEFAIGVGIDQERDSVSRSRLGPRAPWTRRQDKSMRLSLAPCADCAPRVFGLGNS